MVWAGFFHLICLGWLIFRAESVAQLGQMLSLLFQPWPYWIMVGANTVTGTGILTLLAYVAPLLVIELGQWFAQDTEIVLKLSAPVRGVAYAVLFYGMVCYEANVQKQFIYFQF